MRLLHQFLGLVVLLGLSGCMESPTISSTDQPAPFRPWSGIQYENKVILQSAAGVKGPIWLLPWGLWEPDRSGDVFSSISFNHISDLYGTTQYQHGWNIPWIDSEVWIDAKYSEPTLLFATYPQGNPKSFFQNSKKYYLHIPDCSNAPRQFLNNADSLRYNPVGYGANLRSTRFAFFNIEGLNGGLLLVRMVKDPGTHIIWNKGYYLDCADLDSATTEDAFASKWVPLHRSSLDSANTQTITLYSATSTDHGAYVYYGLSLDLNYNNPSKRDARRMITGEFVSLIDTTGKETILDSSITIQDSTYKILSQTTKRFTYFSLFTFKNIAYAFANEGLVRLGETPSEVHYQGSIHSAPTAYFPRCYEVNGLCVLRGIDSLWALDPLIPKEIPLDNQGLKSNQITGVVQYKDTVYVSTLSGVFTKPVARFFDPAR